MGKKITTTYAKLLTLIENARDLAITHQQKKLASDAIRACGIYAENLKIGVPRSRFETLANSLIDKPNGRLHEMFDDIQAQILISGE